MKSNKKILLGAGGIVAALSLIGGGTFAAWSDYDTLAGGAGAGILELDVSSSGGSGTNVEPLGFGNMAPGTSKIQEIFIASSDGDSVPNATLSMKLTDLVGTEDGCHGNSELADEATASVPGPERCDNGLLTPGGQFASQAYIQLKAKPAASPTSCSGGSYVSTTPAANGNVLASLEDVVFTLNANLAPGQGVCVRLELALPDGNITPPGIDFAGTANTDNQVQGDSVDFDVVFNLVQNVT